MPTNSAGSQKEIRFTKDGNPPVPRLRTEFMYPTEALSPSLTTASPQESLTGWLLSWTRGNIAAFTAVMFVAIALRTLNFPSRYDVRDVDEPGYLGSSLSLFEGMTPGYKAAPAGPQIWLGWLYAGTVAARYLVRPTAEESAAPLKVRPFVAVNHALFDLYRDGSVMRLFLLVPWILLSLLGVAAAYTMGFAKGGLSSAVFTGGLFAVLPVFVEFTGMYRPYSGAWSFGILSLACATVMNGRKRWFLAAILGGLAVGSRIEMICILPIVLWCVWDEPRGLRFGRIWLPLTFATLCTAQLIAPWLLTSLFGNLRTIATVRFSPPPAGRHAGMISAAEQLFWVQGLGVTLVGIALLPVYRWRRNSIRELILWSYVILLSLSVFASLGYGSIHQSGQVLVAIVFLAAMACSHVGTANPKLSWLFIAVALAPPLYQASLQVGRRRLDSFSGIVLAVDWLERQQLTTNTVVYFDPGGALKRPLPTQAASDSLWAEVAGPNAWRQKYEAGLTRFGLGSSELPRAMSEENLAQERGNQRPWFILGSRARVGPRFNLHVFSNTTLGLQKDEAEREFLRTGGILIVNVSSSEDVRWIGTPVVTWRSWSGNRVLVYESSGFRKRPEATSSYENNVHR